MDVCTYTYEGGLNPSAGRTSFGICQAGSGERDCSNMRLKCKVELEVSGLFTVFKNNHV